MSGVPGRDGKREFDENDAVRAPVPQKLFTGMAAHETLVPGVPSHAADRGGELGVVARDS